MTQTHVNGENQSQHKMPPRQEGLGHRLSKDVLNNATTQDSAKGAVAKRGTANLDFEFLNSIYTTSEDFGFDVSRAKSSLPNLLSQTVRGSDRVLTTPFLDDFGGPEKLLAKWDPIYNDSVDRLPEPLVDLEAKQKAKIGPRSIQKSWEERRASVWEYFDTPTPLRVTDSQLERSVHAAASHFGAKRNLRPISLDKSIKALKGGTNSGLPYYTKKGDVKHILSRDFNKLGKLYDTGETPCVLFTRTQEQGKTRAVWGYPIYLTLRENMFFRPYLDAERQFNFRAALSGPTEVDKSIERAIRAKRRDEVMVSADLSAYDASIQPKLLETAAEFVTQFFQTKYYNDIHWIGQQMINVGLITPEGVWDTPHGMPSGSVNTNGWDSIVHMLVIWSLYDTDIPSAVVDRIIDHLQIQGDDGFILIPEIYLPQLFEAYENFGLKINVDKTYKSKEVVVYLQNLYIAGTFEQGVYPVYRALNRLMYLERFTQFSDEGLEGRDYFGIRAISIIENTKNHPLHYELTKFVHDHNKYSLLPSAKGLTKYKELMSKSKGADELISHQYGDRLTGFEAWETVKLLRSFG